MAYLIFKRTVYIIDFLLSSFALFCILLHAFTGIETVPKYALYWFSGIFMSRSIIDYIIKFVTWIIEKNREK